MGLPPGGGVGLGPAARVGAGSSVVRSASALAGRSKGSFARHDISARFEVGGDVGVPRRRAGSGGRCMCATMNSITFVASKMGLPVSSQQPTAPSA